jgi:hypothetical protein
MGGGTVGAPALNIKTLRAVRWVQGAGIFLCAGDLAFNLLRGNAAYAVTAVFLLAVWSLLFCVQTKLIRTREHLDRPRPDYAAIARMEREIYGETFEHDGVPVPAAPVRRPAARRCHDGHLRNDDGTCWQCDRRHQRAEIAALHAQGVPYRELAEQFGMSTETVMRIARRDGYRPGNLRWERLS